MSAGILLDCRSDQIAPPPVAFRSVRGLYETTRPVNDRELIAAALDLLAYWIETSATDAESHDATSSADPEQQAGDVADWLRLYFNDKQQEMSLVGYMDRAGRVITVEALGLGTDRMVLVCIRALVRRALHLDARAVFLAHNHPGGDCEPSEADIVLSARIARELAPLGIELTHHHIVGAGKIRSLTAADWAKDPGEYLKPLLIEDTAHADAES